MSQVVDNIFKFANNSLTPSKSDIVLPDSHEIAQVNRVTGSKTVIEPSLNKENMAYIFRFKNLFLQNGRISKKRITVKKHGRLSGIPNVLYEPDKKKAVKEHGLASEMPKDLCDPILGKNSIVKGHPDTSNDLNESIPKKRKTMEGQRLESEITEELYEPISKKRKMETHVPSEVPKDFNVFIPKKRRTVKGRVPKDFNVFIPKKRRTVKGRGLPSKEPKDAYEFFNGYPSEIPKDLYENAVKGLGLVSDIPEDLYMLVKKAVAIRKYLETNEGNRILKLRLLCTEDSIDIHSGYYKYIKRLPRDWKYHPYFWKV